MLKDLDPSGNWFHPSFLRPVSLVEQQSLICVCVSVGDREKSATDAVSGCRVRHPVRLTKARRGINGILTINHAEWSLFGDGKALNEETKNKLQTRTPPTQTSCDASMLVVVIMERKNAEKQSAKQRVPTSTCSRVDRNLTQNPLFVYSSGVRVFTRPTASPVMSPDVKQ